MGRSVYVRSLKGAKAAAESTSLLSGNMSAFPRNRSYQLDYRDTATGAKVVYPDGWKPSNSYEIPTARALAQNGIDVVLRQPVNETEGDPSTTGIKSPDALLKVAGKWQAFDFKAINSETVNIKTAAQRMTRAARNQGGSAVIYLARNLDSGESVNDINRGIIAALSHDQPPRIRTLILLDADGKMQMKERDDFYDTGNGFSEFRGSN